MIFMTNEKRIFEPPAPDPPKSDDGDDSDSVAFVERFQFKHITGTKKWVKRAAKDARVKESEWLRTVVDQALRSRYGDFR